MKRLWNLETNTYKDSALDKKTKEMFGLVASMVLRCDDCIKYDLGKAHELVLPPVDIRDIFSCQYCRRNNCDSSCKRSSRIR